MTVLNATKCGYQVHCKRTARFVSGERKPDFFKTTYLFKNYKAVSFHSFSYCCHAGLDPTSDCAVENFFKTLYNKKALQSRSAFYSSFLLESLAELSRVFSQKII